MDVGNQFQRQSGFAAAVNVLRSRHALSNGWPSLVVVTSMILAAIGTSQAPAQTNWVATKPGDWFEPNNWSRGVPTLQLDAVVANGHAISRNGKVTRLQTSSLVVGSDASTKETAQAILEAQNTRLESLGDIMIGQAIGNAATHGMLVMSRDTDSPADTGIRFNADLMVGLVGPGADGAQADGLAFVDGDITRLVGASRIPAVMRIGVTDGSGVASGELTAVGPISGFHDVQVGVISARGTGAAVGTLTAMSGLVGDTDAEGVLAIGLNQNTSGIARGTVIVEQALLGYQQIVVGNATGKGTGSAFGELRLNQTKLETSRLTLGEIVEPNQTVRARGALELNDATVVALTTTIGSLSSARGTGAFVGHVTNAGVLSPGGTTADPGNSLGILQVDGRYAQLPSGTLRIDMDRQVTGAAASDQLQVTQDASLDGFLQIRISDNFKPSFGASYPIIRAGKIGGQFRGWQVHGGLGDIAIDFVNDGQIGSLVFVKPQQEHFLTPAAATVNWSSNEIWSNGRVPRSFDQLDLRNQATDSRTIVLDSDAVVASALLAGDSDVLLLQIPSGRSFSTTHDLTVARRGRIELQDGTLNAAHMLIKPGGRFYGQGTFTGDLQNEGVLNVGTTKELAALTIEGDFQQTSRGMLLIGGQNVGGNLFDTIQISGQATLSGRLQIDLLDDMTFEVGQEYEILHADGGIQGRFTAFDGFDFQRFQLQGIGFQLTYDEDSVLFASYKIVLGDMDGDLDVDLDDVDDFARGLKDPESYQLEYGRPPFFAGNTNLDFDFDYDDICSFLDLVEGTGSCEEAAALLSAVSVPEPSGLGWAAFGILAFVGVRLRKRSFIPLGN